MINSWNEEFTSNAREPLRDLSPYSTGSLEWLMMEHYQFSFLNTKFLWKAAERAGGFDTEAIKNELIRNYKEENGHAAMYKLALKKIGVDVGGREEFGPTTTFLDAVGELCKGEPSFVLGTIFATEAAAIFEHEVFKDVSEEVIARKCSGKEGKPLVGFHQMHLEGVEQSHKDELGIFLRGIHADQEVVAGTEDRPTLKPQQVLSGGRQAIHLMKMWWAGLFAELYAKNGIAARTAQP